VPRAIPHARREREPAVITLIVTIDARPVRVPVDQAIARMERVRPDATATRQIVSDLRVDVIVRRANGIVEGRDLEREIEKPAATRHEPAGVSTSESALRPAAEIRETQARGATHTIDARLDRVQPKHSVQLVAVLGRWSARDQLGAAERPHVD